MSKLTHYQKRKMGLINFESFNEICLIDDDASYIFLNKTILRYTFPNIQPVTFYDIQNAYDYLRTNHSKKILLILDLNLGPYTGFDLLDMLSSTDIYDITVIMHTTRDEDEYVEKAFSYAMVKAYILKPLTVDIIEQLNGNLPLSQPEGKMWEMKLKH